MRYHPINPALFQQNRKRFAREMKPDSIAIFHSNENMPRSGDQFFGFKQNPDLFYLTGLDQPDTVLVLFPDCLKENLREIAFIKKGDVKTNTWEGEKLNKQEASNISGLDKIFWLDDMKSILRDLILQAKRIYINGNENERFHSEVMTRDQRFSSELMNRYPFHKYHRSQPILKKLRMIKSTPEIELMGNAAMITGKAFENVLKTTTPGIKEYEIEAKIIGTFIAHGANGHAYEPIIASGPSACILHYTKNNQTCQDGDLLLLDFGAEYANYAADLTRTIPVNGQFSDRQKQVYEATLHVHKEAKKMMVPGMTMEEINKEIGKIMTYELITLGLLDKKDSELTNTKNPAYFKYFMHGIGHHLGLDVHDLSDRFIPLQSGMIITCEPGIYIKEEGMGVRIENDILITDEGPVDLMENVPIEVEEIEMLMHENALS